ncbi:MAG: hypothetical protein DRP08_04155, partial [Candidatus Aenigmatarchaeota archaeon]
KFLDSFNWLIAIINKGLRSLITSVDDLDNSTSSSGGKVPSTSTHVAMSGSAQAYGWGGNIPGGYGSEVGTNNSGRISMGGAAQAYGWSGNIPGQSTDQMAEFFIIFKKHMNETIDGLINASKAMDAASASMEEAARKTAEDKVTFLSSIEGFKKIEKVIDGDTMKIKVGDEELSVRIRAIDTPESVDPLKRETNRYNDPISNVMEGQLASEFAKLIVGKGGGLTFSNVGETDDDRYLADATMKSGFDYGELLVRLGIAAKTDYEAKKKDALVAIDDIFTEESDLGKSATKTLLLQIETIKKLGESKGIDFEKTKEEDIDNWEKRQAYTEEMAKAFYDTAGLTGGLGITEYFRARNKEIQESTKRLTQHQAVLIETGKVTEQFTADSLVQIETESRLLREAGVERKEINKIRKERTDELSYEERLQAIGQMSELEVEYAEKVSEESLRVDMQYWARRREAAKIESEKIMKYTGDAVAAEITQAKERIAYYEQGAASGILLFGITKEMSDETIDLLRETANEEARIVAKQIGGSDGMKAARIKALQDNIKIYEMINTKVSETFNATGVATQEYYETQRIQIELWAAHYAQLTGDAYTGERYAMEQNIALFQEMHEVKNKIAEEFYATTGSMLKDQFQYQAELIALQAEQMTEELQAQGYESGDARNISSAVKQMKLFNLEVKNLRSSKNVFRAFEMGIMKITEATKSSAESMHEFGIAINEAFDASLKGGLTDFMKSQTFDLESLMTEILGGFLDAWSNAMVDMAQQWLTKNQTIVAAEKAMASEVIAINTGKEAAMMANEAAAIDARLQLFIFEMEYKAALEEAYWINKEARELGTIQAVNAVAFAEIAAAEAVSEYKMAASEIATDVVIANYARQTAAAQASAVAQNAAQVSTGYGAIIVAVGLIASQMYSSFMSKDSSKGPSRDDALKTLADELRKLTDKLGVQNSRMERLIFKDNISRWLERIVKINEDMAKDVKTIKDTVIPQAIDLAARSDYAEYERNWQANPMPGDPDYVPENPYRDKLGKGRDEWEWDENNRRPENPYEPP